MTRDRLIIHAFTILRLASILFEIPPHIVHYDFDRIVLGGRALNLSDHSESALFIFGAVAHNLAGHVVVEGKTDAQWMVDGLWEGREKGVAATAQTHGPFDTRRSEVEGTVRHAVALSCTCFVLSRNQA